MTFSRTVACHYSFMHENLLDMNHQFLHRGVVGRIQAAVARLPGRPGLRAGPVRVHPRRRPEEPAAALLARSPAGSSSDVFTIRTGYPYQTLRLAPAEGGPAAFSLWAAYVPRDAAQRTSDAYGLLMIARPPVPGALELAWPLIRRFTERVFAEDRMAVEAEQRAWDEQGRDCNHEVFPLILDLRDMLRSNGVPIGPDPACAAPPRPRSASGR